MEEIQKNVLKFLTEYGFQIIFQIIGAVIILLAGGWLARWIGRVADQWLEKKHIEPPMPACLPPGCCGCLVFGLAAVLALEKCGVPIAPMVAGIGVAGVALGWPRKACSPTSLLD